MFMPETRILDHLYAAHRFLSDLESVPRDYGSGEPLYASEIHTVVAVYRNPGLNLTTLALALGVSKAATSKFVAKLVRRGYIRKYKADDNKRDVLFEATEKGSAVAKGHKRFEEQTFAPLLQVERALSSEERATIEAYFGRLLLKTR